MGSPILFKQPRPGLIGKDGKEKIFYMYKFRTMTNERDEHGDLLADEKRLPAFGRLLRATSLDELPEAINILKGDMSVIGPRPQLVRDMVFMTEEQRLRHTAKPGLSGLAQIKGRNAISWEEKLDWDLKYIDKVSFTNDILIMWRTVLKVFGGNESETELDVTDDYGDYLLKSGRITSDEYKEKQQQARELLRSMIK